MWPQLQSPCSSAPVTRRAASTLSRFAPRRRVRPWRRRARRRRRAGLVPVCLERLGPVKKTRRHPNCPYDD